MNIVMFTNTFTPHVGGVARSVSGLAEGLRELGHDVLVVAPEFPGASEDVEGVIRMPAVQRFAGSDFSVPLPLTLALTKALDAFAPEVVHSHHPFLLGDTALRASAAYDIPVVFTYHTRYELYGHYVAQDSAVLKRLALSLSIGYCNLCDHVIAPSESILRHLSENGVTAPITTIPTGIDQHQFSSGDGKKARAALGIPPDACVVGHVGRLAAEKNLHYLTDALVEFLQQRPSAHVVVAGDGAERVEMSRRLGSIDFGQRVHFTGVVAGAALADLYAALDVFAFASCSETQGLVLAEAMTAGVPVVALDAPGAREIVRDGRNGRLLPQEASASEFAEAVGGLAALGPADAAAVREAARKTAAGFSREASVERTLDLYRRLEGRAVRHGDGTDTWETAKRSLAREWKIFGNLAHAVGDAVLSIESPSRDRGASTGRGKETTPR